MSRNRDIFSAQTFIFVTRMVAARVVEKAETFDTKGIAPPPAFWISYVHYRENGEIEPITIDSNAAQNI